MFVHIHLFFHVCVCMYVGVHICIYRYVGMYICAGSRQRTPIGFQSLPAQMVRCMYVCMYVCMYLYVYVCMYVCMYVRTYVCMYVCRYMCKDRWRGTESKEQGSAAQAQRALSGAHLRAHSNYVYMYVCMYEKGGHWAPGRRQPASCSIRVTGYQKDGVSWKCALLQ